MVYTRVHFSLLGSGYVMGLYISRVQMFLSSVYASRLPCPQALVISCLGPADPALYSLVMYGELCMGPLVTFLMRLAPSHILYLATQEIRGARE